jgi:hypothetical protein
VVVGQDDINAQGLGPKQRLSGGHAVVDGHEEANAIAMQAIHHGGIESVAILLAAGDGCQGLGPQPSQHPNKERRTGHAIGVVIATNGYSFSGLTCPAQAFNGLIQVGEMLDWIRGVGGIEECLDSLGCIKATPLQHR